MRENREELILALISLGELEVGRVQRFLGLLHASEVDHRNANAGDRPACVAHWFQTQIQKHALVVRCDPELFAHLAAGFHDQALERHQPRRILGGKQVGVGLANHLRAVHGALVEGPQEAQVAVLGCHRDRGVLEGEAEPLFARPQRLLGPLPLGDILEIADNAVDLALGVAPGHVGPVEKLRFARRRAQRHLHMDRFARLQDLSLDGGELVSILARQKIVVSLADHVLLGEAELGIDDQSIAQLTVLDLNVVRSVVGDGPKTLLAFPQCLFCLFAVVDVAQIHVKPAGTREHEHFVPAIVQWRGRLVVLQAAFGHGIKVVLVDARAHDLRKDVPYDLAEQLAGWPPERRPLGRRVHHVKTPLGVERIEGVCDTAQDCGGSAGRFEQRRLGPFALANFQIGGPSWRLTAHAHTSEKPVDRRALTSPKIRMVLTG